MKIDIYETMVDSNDMRLFSYIKFLKYQNFYNL